MGPAPTTITSSNSTLLIGHNNLASTSQPIEVVGCYRHNSNNQNNQHRVKSGNPNPDELIQDKDAKRHHSDRQAKRKGTPFQDVYLPEEDQCPGKARDKEY